MSINFPIQPASDAGGKSSLVQHFAIQGLFGYRSVSLASEYAATILIAHNGAGKTTMLGALDAFLRCQFGRLAELTFQRIECKLRTLPEMLVLEKTDLDHYLKDVAENSAILRTAKQFDLDPQDVLFFVLWEFPLLSSKRQLLNQNPVFNKVYNHHTHTYDSTYALFQELSKGMSIPGSPIESLRQKVSTALGETEIVYLPTYRRIELSLPEQEEPRYGRKPVSVHARLGLTRRGLHTGDIQFGLSDISARLKELNQEIMFESNQKYAEISANIIDDLISGSFEKQSPSLEERPSRQELGIFFERMKAGGRSGLLFAPYYGPYGPAKIPDFDRIYSGRVPENSQKFLTYFLGKLNSVIQKTRDTENIVDSFVRNCNRYLSGTDSTTDGEGIDVRDEKNLQLDRATLDVSVWRKRPAKEIPLDALSSGEKQMISLFARLYLYPRDKLILIDEPELSLSLDWQRKILPDILNAPHCRQVIAITHSPFIFDNELDAFATALRIQISNQDFEGGN
ncbi:AAA family ATPase [Roseateles flavus]|uniref:AAA family ATPase n=1 Tax=Roseateles flavus TaxID=3149041 RepID=A0ABV0GDN9_9BURK